MGACDRSAAAAGEGRGVGAASLTARPIPPSGPYYLRAAYLYAWRAAQRGLIASLQLELPLGA